MCQCHVKQKRRKLFSSFSSNEILFHFIAEGGQGSWESGITYECRSLLFKALHNLIERLVCAQ